MVEPRWFWLLSIYPEGVTSVSPGLRRASRRYPGRQVLSSYPNGVSSRSSGARNAMKPRWGMESNCLVPRVGDAPTLGFGLQPLWSPSRSNETKDVAFVRGLCTTEKSGKGLGKPGATGCPSRSEATPSHMGFGGSPPSGVRGGSPGFLQLDLVPALPG